MTYDDGIPILSAFQQASPPPPQKATNEKSRKTPPFSLRLTQEEKTYLKAKAGKQPLGAYIRDQLLDDQVHRKRRNLRQPSVDDAQFAALLGMLGDSRIASNLNQLAKHANCGTLDVSAEVEAELVKACAAVLAMRNVLYKALGHKVPKAEGQSE